MRIYLFSANNCPRYEADASVISGRVIFFLRGWEDRETDGKQFSQKENEGENPSARNQEKKV